MLFGPKERLHSGRIPDHCDWHKIKESWLCSDSVSIALLLRKVAVGRPGSQEKTGYVLTSCPMYDPIRETYFPQITQIHKELENKPDVDNLPYLLGEITQCDITAARCVTCCHKKRSTSEEQTPL